MTRPYHEYEVVRPLPRSVQQGDIAPWFEQPGGGTQYFFRGHDIDWFVRKGYLREIS